MLQGRGKQAHTVHEFRSDVELRAVLLSGTEEGEVEEKDGPSFHTHQLLSDAGQAIISALAEGAVVLKRH